jgi:hypothetical protein
VETGTFKGTTTKWASACFGTVHTVELSDYLFNQVKDILLAKGNITPWLGNSRDILPLILQNEQRDIIFWLDGHYSGGMTAGEADPCPLLDELEIILQRNNNDIILIDDSRLMGWERGYPTIVDICAQVRQKGRFIQIFDDVICIVPDKQEYKDAIVKYIVTLALDRKNPVKKYVKILAKKTGLYKKWKKYVHS